MIEKAQLCSATIRIAGRIASFKNLTIETPLPHLKSYPFTIECAIRET